MFWETHYGRAAAEAIFRRSFRPRVTTSADNPFRFPSPLVAFRTGRAKVSVPLVTSREHA
eukprot:4009557-Prymnesium_polylepis.1